MRQNKKVERAFDALAEMLKTYSGVSEETISEMKEAAPTGKEAISRQGDAVLLFLENPAKYTAKLCKKCGEPFGTNYRSVGYCSDRCRAKDMYEILGIKWDYLKPLEERWGGEPPLIIPPAALRKIQQFVEFFAGVQAIQTQRGNPPELIPDPLLPQQTQVPDEQISDVSQEAHTIPEQSPPELPPEQPDRGESPFDFG